jgi:hypothetical protein
MHARVVQTGNTASQTVQLPAAAFRNKQISILGQSIFVTPIDVRRTAYAALAQAARGGAISLDMTSARLDEAGAAWRRLAEGAPEEFYGISYTKGVGWLFGDVTEGPSYVWDTTNLARSAGSAFTAWARNSTASGCSSPRSGGNARTDRRTQRLSRARRRTNAHHRGQAASPVP